MTSFTISSHDIVEPSSIDERSIRAYEGFQRKLSEDFAFLPIPWFRALDDWHSFGDGLDRMPMMGVSGTVNDRRGGRMLPLFWNEIDLRFHRVMARYLCDANPFAIGAMNRLVNYHVRSGYGWQACFLGADKSPYAGPTSDPLIRRVQHLLDRWRDVNLWAMRSREAFRRWRRDGEVFGRFFRSGWERLPQFRFIEPEQIGSPDGMTDGPRSFGIENEKDDVLTIWAYHQWSMEDPGVGEWIDAGEIIHAKANVDSTVKRGIPDFYPVYEMLPDSVNLIRTMLKTAIRQASIAWREKFPTASLAQIQGLTPLFGRGGSRPPEAQATSLPWWSERGRGQHPPGTIQRTEGNREFEDGPTASGVQNFMLAVQASLRAAGVRWDFPEFSMSGDASNNPYNATIASASPFCVAVEGNQLDWKLTWERPAALKVLDHLVDARLVTRAERSKLDVEIIAPAVATPKPKEDTDRRKVLNEAGVICLDTWRQQEGVDPQHESAGIAKDIKDGVRQKPGAGGGGQGQDNNPQATTDDQQPNSDKGGTAGYGGIFRTGLSESEHKDGDVWQGSSNRWFTMKDGRVVPAKAPGSADGSSTSKERTDVKTSTGDVLPAVVGLLNANDAGFAALRTAVFQNPEDKGLLDKWTAKAKDPSGALTKRIADLGNVAHHPGESVKSTIDRAARKRLFLRDNPKEGESAADFAYRHYPELKGFKPVSIEGNALNTDARTAVHEAWEMMPALQQLAVKGTSWHVGNGMVPQLDSMGHLADIQPRGWTTEGKTWSNAAGAYDPINDKVIAGGGGGHGSDSVFAHETGHALGKHFGLNDSPETKIFHEALFDKLPPYLQQGGPGGEAGRQEMIAETIATYVRHGEAHLAKTTSPQYAEWLAGKLKRIVRGRS